MASVLTQQVASASITLAPHYPPINFFYLHFHNSIRAELDSLAQSVLHLEASSDQDVYKHLTGLKQRYQFLEQVYKYHSSVEDEVVYPALEGKVRNVTNAYSVEHQDEELLFEQLSQLLSTALIQNEQARQATIRRLVCKVEEIHTTLRKHLAKEEEQLQPLLLRHFTFAEQAELVAQFLYCIPLATVERVLSWLKPTVPKDEQEQLLIHIRAVISDDLLLQLLVTWLAPLPPAASSSASASSSPTTLSPGEPLPCDCPSLPLSSHTHIDTATHPPADRTSHAPSSRPPLQDIVHVHHSIKCAMETLAREARALQRAGDVTPQQLAMLCERHRFLRSVCTFHTRSEEEVMFPEVARISQLGPGGAGGGGAGGLQGGRACQKCKEEHEQEVAMFEELGRLLAEMKAFARRGRKEVTQMLEQLSRSAECVVAAVRVHMQREESEVLPLLQEHLCTQQQRALVWRTLRAMPLRLLERVMPWLMDKLSEDEAAEMLRNMELGAPEADAALVLLLSRWAQRGRLARAPSSPHSSLSCPTCTPQLPDASTSDKDKDGATSASAATTDVALLAPAGSLPAPEDDLRWYGNDTCRLRLVVPRQGSAGEQHEGGRPVKRPRTCCSEDECSSASEPFTRAPTTAACSPPAAPPSPSSAPAASAPASRQKCPTCLLGYNPIDHIFQFHKALRTELKQLEEDAMALEAAALSLPTPTTILSHPPPTPTSPPRPLPSPSHPHPQPPAPIPDAPAPAHPSPALPDPDALPSASLMPPQHSASLSAFTVDMARAIQQLDGRFQFLWGIYRAHSRAEDEIVFPALESKEALLNVSHAYTLDHVAEEQLFHDVHAVVLRLKQSAGGADTQELALQLRRMCAAVRASLETHVRAEERELWPLFAEHFTVEEQQVLVGIIIGRTGAEVLQAMLPWVTAPFNEEERDAMMESLREATKNTKFDRWLDAIQGSQPPPDPSAPATAAPNSHGPSSSSSDHLQGPLEEVAEYLRGTQEASGTVAESTAFRPGWEDLFRMNQKQLEASVRRVSNDPNLEPERKAYLLQHLMVSRYIVAQQKRMRQGASTPTLPPQPQQPAPSPAVGGASAEPPPQPPVASASGAPKAETLRTFADAEARTLGCRHYKRRCKLVAPCCGKAYTCRMCHDEVAGHQMDRYAVSELVCMECGLQQPVGGSCSGCGVQLAQYYCSICHLFDDEPGRQIYHCPFCNVCRRGRGLGVDFFHCMNCNSCMSLSLAASHKCREKCMEGNCPVCHEYLFDSSEPIKELPCGHFLHSSCFATYTRHSYTCPVCAKSIGDMSVYFQMLDFLLSREVLPPEYRDRCQPVLCHDCGRQGSAPFHFVYHKCPHCRSYNTRVL